MGFAVITDWGWEEGRIIAAAKAGDEAAIVKLLDRYFPQIQKWMLSFAHDEERAKALTEKVYQAMLQELPQYRWPETPVVTWLYQLALRVMAEAARPQPVATR